MKTNKDDTEIGRRLRALRVYRGKSGEELGAVLGVTRQQISLIERGVSRMTANQALAAAKFLGVKVGVLIGEEPFALPGEDDDPEDCACRRLPADVVALVRRATPEGLERLVKLATVVLPNKAAA